MTKQDTLAVRSSLAACVPVGDVSDTDRFDALGEWAADPMAPDEPDDGIVVTTRRRLLRVSILAAEVGARFAREGIECDPSAWMLTPRRAFDGGRPIDACQGLREFERGILLHGLALGLDLDPDTLDGLLSDGDEPTCETADGGPATIH